MEISPEKIEEIKQEARREVASKAGKAGVIHNMARVMKEKGFSTIDEAKRWYFREIRKKGGGRPKKSSPNRGK